MIREPERYTAAAREGVPFAEPSGAVFPAEYPDTTIVPGSHPDEPAESAAPLVHLDFCMNSRYDKGRYRQILPYPLACGTIRSYFLKVFADSK